jgi:hypothetical protein
VAADAGGDDISVRVVPGFLLLSQTRAGFVTFSHRPTIKLYLFPATWQVHIPQDERLADSQVLLPSTAVVRLVMLVCLQLPSPGIAMRFARAF